MLSILVVCTCDLLLHSSVLYS